MRKKLWVGTIAAAMMMTVFCTGCGSTAMANSLSDNMAGKITLIEVGTGAGFVEIDGKICYVNEAGEIQKNWVQMDNGDWYYFDQETGELQVNTYSHDGYWVGEDGVWDGEEAIQGPAVAAAEKEREARRNETAEAETECEPLPELEREEDDIEEMVKFPWEREEAEGNEPAQPTEPEQPAEPEQSTAPGELESPIVPENPPVENVKPDTEGNSDVDSDDAVEQETECEPLPELEREIDDIDEMVNQMFGGQDNGYHPTKPEQSTTPGELEPPIVPEHPPVEWEAPDTEGDSGADFDEDEEIDEM